ncbi:MAG: hypothetical protein QXT20_03870 [Candidatus Woesearchaeota archaeon]
MVHKVKRGQVYVFAALVICVLLYALYAETGSKSVKLKQYNKCSELAREIPKMFDYALYSNQNGLSVLSEFNNEFSEYALASGEPLGFVYGAAIDRKIYLASNSCNGCELIVYYSDGNASVVENNCSYEVEAENISGIELVFQGRNYSMMPESISGIKIFCYSGDSNNLQINYQ